MATKKAATGGTRKATAKKSPAKKTTAKRAPAKKTATKKTTTRGTQSDEPDQSGQDRTPAKKSATRRSPRSSGQSSPDGSSRRGSAPRAAAGKKMTAPKIAARAAEQLLELTGREVEGVTGLERTDDGWTVEVEVVEVRRIPDTTDVLALYELTVDSDGDLEGYRRLRRYGRGVPGRERD